MSNIGLIIEERPTIVGNFMVGRLLPFREKRMVGPFIFIDHMGPEQLSEADNFDVPPHPHIGLSTLTYLFEGEIMHRDSLGTELVIKPGQVNWMTAGRGIVHSERTPQYLRDKPKSLHGLQIWVALPKHLEEMAPSFHHAEGDDLPAWEETGLAFRLIAGDVMGRKSSVPVYSPLYLIEIKAIEDATVDIGSSLFGESALYILEGSISSDGNRFGPKQILVATDSTLCRFEMEKGTTVYLFGGEAFAEERHIYWNFVSSDKNRIEEAKERWLKQEFVRVPGETEWVPLPEQKPGFRVK
ncbi:MULTISPECIES: pirin family protein [unclassified Flavobacterium]|uniref:pirin family protein n=1 Tax=unclassified Flavobacterium TaxID=196869 RepID=UPI001F130852|nr:MULTISPECIES: pirin family protein [unclassified Flavobacterium]UMY65161.1 pirin family protein [Flavobacterium sp. HJ-32-4]